MPRPFSRLALLRLVCLLLSLSPAFSQIAKAQANFVYAGYTQCTWDDIHLADSSFKSADSSIVFASTRNYTPGSKEFLNYKIASDSSLHYFTIYFSSNRWIAAPRKNLSDALNGLAPADYVVYTEGDGKTFPDNIDRSTRITRLYHTRVIVFDWASRVPTFKGGQNVRNTVRNTKSLQKQYRDLLLALKNLKAEQPAQMLHLTLFFHSLGNAVFQHSIEKFGHGDYGKNLVDNIVLNAACVNARGHKKWVEKLAFQTQVYVLYNRKDKTLRAASLLFGKRLLGCQLNRALASNTMYINMGLVASNKHNYFVILPLLKEQPGIRMLFNNLFHGGSVPLSDTRFFEKGSSGNGYTLHSFSEGSF
jgi:hypothetical protein